VAHVVGNLPDGKKYAAHDVGNLPDGKKYAAHDVGNLPDDKKYAAHVVGNLPDGKKYVAHVVGNLPDGKKYGTVQKVRFRHCERSEAIQKAHDNNRSFGLRPRKDGETHFLDTLLPDGKKFHPVFRK
jgi:hypothetical protein